MAKGYTWSECCAVVEREGYRGMIFFWKNVPKRRVVRAFGRYWKSGTDTPEPFAPNIQESTLRCWQPSDDV